MNEFSLIDQFFKNKARRRPDVIYGIGDDAACLQVPLHQQLLISTDTLVAEVHFVSSWDPYDIAYRAVMVNVSDMAAMAAQPCWASLALTLPAFDQQWLTRFAQGLHEALTEFDIALIGGDTTKGPLTITLTIHGLAPAGKALRRNGASPGDKIYVSGELGAAALAVCFLQRNDMADYDKALLMHKLQHPKPRLDFNPILQATGSAAIDISDGLSADLNHLCVASGVGACLDEQSIPIHPLVTYYQADSALELALSGGDDYELCFTIPAQHENLFTRCLAKANLTSYLVGMIEKQPGLRLKTPQGEIRPLCPKGYSHF